MLLGVRDSLERHGKEKSVPFYPLQAVGAMCTLGRSGHLIDMISSFLNLRNMIMLSEVRFEQSEAIHLFLLCGDSLLKHHFKDFP